MSSLGPDEVNFWQPSGRAPFANAPVGMPFLFKLKYPVNAIVGGGFFVTFSRLNPRMVWDMFGERNGCKSFVEMISRIGGSRRPDRQNDEIGCTVLVNLFFLSPENWIPEPDGFSRNIVVGKGYDSESGDGQALWNRVVAAMARQDLIGATAPDELILPATGVRQPATPNGGYGTSTMVKPRLGQGAFKVLVTDAYQRRCAITGENTLEVLQAAHIYPFAQGGPHEITNGMLLRMDFHSLR